MTPRFVTEAELDQQFKTKSLLESGGNYGCGAVLLEGDLVDDAEGIAGVLEDVWFHALNEQHPNDVGTVLVTGDVVARGDVFVSDRLMCLVVLGSVKARSLHVFETETWIGGRLEVSELEDRDGYVTVAKR